MRAHLLPGLIALLAVGACDDEPKKNPFEGPPKTTVEPPAVSVEKPKGPPQLLIDDQGPKVGWSRVLIEKKDGEARLKKALSEHKAHFDGKVLTVQANRKAKSEWVIMFLKELEALGAESVIIKTDSRKSYPQELPFHFPSKVKEDAKPCAVVGTVLDDRGTAIWKLAGGTASKRARGQAGPDLTMTQDTIERYSGKCKDSKLFFVSRNDGIEWGLTYDLAAAAKAHKEAKLETIVLLQDKAVAGRKVDL